MPHERSAVDLPGNKKRGVGLRLAIPHRPTSLADERYPCATSALPADLQDVHSGIYQLFVNKKNTPPFFLPCVPHPPTCPGSSTTSKRAPSFPSPMSSSNESTSEPLPLAIGSAFGFACGGGGENTRHRLRPCREKVDEDRPARAWGFPRRGGDKKTGRFGVEKISATCYG